MKAAIFCMAAATITAGCSSYGAVDPPGNYPVIAAAAANLSSATGTSMGNATIRQIGADLRVRVEGVNLPNGAHAMHIHQTGSCIAPDFASARPHWNPGNAQHGKDNPAGMHLGDLPNLLIGTDGRGTMEYVIPAASLSGRPGSLFDGDGAALVVHAATDDYRTDPSGQSGGRIACGILGPAAAAEEPR